METSMLKLKQNKQGKFIFARDDRQEILIQEPQIKKAVTGYLYVGAGNVKEEVDIISSGICAQLHCKLRSKPTKKREHEFVKVKFKVQVIIED